MDISIEHDAMENIFVVFRFEVVANFVNFVVEIGSFGEHRNKIGDKKCTGDCFLVVVLNVNVDNVNRNVARAFSVLEKLDDLIVNAFLASNDHIKLLGTSLKSFGSQFDSPVSVEHVQESVLCVTESRKC